MSRQRGFSSVRALILRAARGLCRAQAFSRPRDAEARFTDAYLHCGFGGASSASGPGSDLIQTAAIRRAIPSLFMELRAQSLLDIPCGDFNWMRHVTLDAVQYIGADVVAELVSANQRRYGNDRRQFQHLDLTRDTLPAVDVVFCRDCFVHLTPREILSAISNIQRSECKYLLTTTFPSVSQNKGLGIGWRPLNMQLRPFRFPEPLKLINEGCTEQDGRYADKSLGLWRIADL